MFKSISLISSLLISWFSWRGVQLMADILKPNEPPVLATAYFRSCFGVTVLCVLLFAAATAHTKYASAKPRRDWQLAALAALHLQALVGAISLFVCVFDQCMVLGHAR